MQKTNIVSVNLGWDLYKNRFLKIPFGYRSKFIAYLLGSASQEDYKKWLKNEQKKRSKAD